MARSLVQNFDKTKVEAKFFGSSYAYVRGSRRRADGGVDDQDRFADSFRATSHEVHLRRE